MDANYLGFFTDVMTFDLLRGFRRLGAVAPELLWYSASGLIVAMVADALRALWVHHEAERILGVASVHHPFAAAAVQVRRSGRPARAVTLAAAGRLIVGVLALPAIAVLLHLLLLAQHALFGSSVGGWTDTVNAVAATTAVLLPITAIGGLAQRLGETPARLHPTMRGATFSTLITLVLTIIPGIWASAASIHAIAAIHGTSTWHVLLPVMILAAAFGPLAALAARRSLRAGT